MASSEGLNEVVIACYVGVLMLRYLKTWMLWCSHLLCKHLLIGWFPFCDISPANNERSRRPELEVGTRKSVYLLYQEVLQCWRINPASPAWAVNQSVGGSLLRSHANQIHCVLRQGFQSVHAVQSEVRWLSMFSCTSPQTPISPHGCIRCFERVLCWICEWDGGNSGFRRVDSSTSTVRSRSRQMNDRSSIPTAGIVSAKGTRKVHTVLYFRYLRPSHSTPLIFSTCASAYYWYAVIGTVPYAVFTFSLSPPSITLDWAATHRISIPHSSSEL